MTIIVFGHIANGNVHVNILYDPQNPKQADNAEPCLNALFDLVVALRGTISGEHGIGVVKRDHIYREVDNQTLQLMQNIKAQFDPANILNPNKVLPRVPDCKYSVNT